MQSTVNVPADLIEVFRSELETTRAEAARSWAEAKQLGLEGSDGEKARLEQALAVEGPEAPGDLTGPAHTLASTGRGVLHELVADLSNEADRATLDTDLMQRLARLVATWSVEVARLEAEAGAV